MITIRRLDNGDELFTHDVDSVKDAVEQAVKRGIILFRADLSGADLSGADLGDANLLSASLSGANLRGTNLRRANLSSANLWGADLRHTNLIDANLMDANLIDADLWGANIVDTNLMDANLMDANLMDAYLMGADLRGAKNIFRAGQSKDGYAFYAINGRDGVIIKAGCRWFSVEEARKHWAETRGGTELGEERLRLVDEIEDRARKLGWM